MAISNQQFSPRRERRRPSTTKQKKFEQEAAEEAERYNFKTSPSNLCSLPYLLFRIHSPHPIVSFCRRPGGGKALPAELALFLFRLRLFLLLAFERRANDGFLIDYLSRAIRRGLLHHTAAQATG